MVSGSIKAPIECWLLFLLARLDAHRSTAQRILKKRVVNGSLPLSLIQQSVSDNADLVTRYEVILFMHFSMFSIILKTENVGFIVLISYIHPGYCTEPSSKFCYHFYLFFKNTEIFPLSLSELLSY